MIVPYAVVADIGGDDGVMRQGGAVLELVVPRDAVGVVLEHIAGGSALSAVPVMAAQDEAAPADVARDGDG